VSTGTARLALPAPIGRHEASPRLRAQAHPQRPLVRLAAFAALGLYGVLRWGTLVSGGVEGRLLGLLGVAVLLAGAGALLARRSRLLGVLAAILAVLAAFPLAGAQVEWVLHLRVAVTASAIGDGLSALPRVLVPYVGVNAWVRMVIVLGAGALLLDAAMLLAFAPRELGDLRRAGAALPLVALAAVPSTLVRPRFPYLDGLVLFALLAAFMWGERIGRRQLAAALGLCAVAAVTGMVSAPALERHHPWLNYRALTGSLAPGAVDTFDWSQRYGPINWPRRGRTVLEIRAASSEYWKAENLDTFNGDAWTEGLIPGAQSMPAPAGSSIASWSQTIQVTVGDMRISDLIGAGVTAQPARLAQPVAPGFSPGTWTAGSDLGPGDSYVVRVYAPDPTAAQLRGAGADYGGIPPGYRTLALPAASASAGQTNLGGAEIVFPPFHSRAPVRILVDVPSRDPLGSSPYAPAYALARRLASKVRTPYGYVLAVKRWLAHGYTYSEHPPRRAYPLEAFLFKDKVGYCQQFAGAMALLLRMGGVPARVAVGFTPGSYDSATHRWLVSDLDAHAWVEAWFPRYGWVRFDPTPGADPALGGSSLTASATSAGASGAAVHAPRRSQSGASPGSSGGGRAPSSARAGSGIGPFAAALLIGALGLIVALLLGTRPLAPGERLVGELERALARSGRPLAGGVTLAALERRLSGSPDAAAYVRALRLQRFSAVAEPPTPAQRRALRAQLRLGLGPLGALRALWALPPRRRSARRRGGDSEGF
jgi:transglutaminase-like putative cysteine protease